MPLLVLYVQVEPMRQKDLADALYLDSSSLVRVLAQLREAQMVDWTSDPADKRTKCIALTPAGRKAAALILAKSLEIEQAILSDLTKEELDVTRRSLEKISQRFDALRCGETPPVGGPFGLPDTSNARA
jgi:MarR family transcriptional regulator for hemolysin